MATSRYTKVAALIIRWTEELDLQAEGHTNEVDYPRTPRLTFCYANKPTD
jgi:hypothetical protein